MFKEVVTALISGNFVCQVSNPAGFDFLSDTRERDGMTNAEDVDQYIRRIGMKLSVTKSEGAYYVSHMNVDEDGRKASKILFTDIKNNIRLIIEFFKLVMDSTGNDYSVNPGEKIHVNKMMGLISANPSLIEALRKVANISKSFSTDGTDRQRLDKIIKKFRQDGYLEEVSREQEIYQFTGKIEYSNDSIEFLMQNDNISEDDKEFDSKEQSL